MSCQVGIFSQLPPSSASLVKKLSISDQRAFRFSNLASLSFTLACRSLPFFQAPSFSSRIPSFLLSSFHPAAYTASKSEHEIHLPTSTINNHRRHVFAQQDHLRRHCLPRGSRLRLPRGTGGQRSRCQRRDRAYRDQNSQGQGLFREGPWPASGPKTRASTNPLASIYRSSQDCEGHKVILAMDAALLSAPQKAISAVSLLDLHRRF
jgi:hypothetical protein